jgi:hypothetical protein
MTRAMVQVTVVKVLAALTLMGAVAHADAPVRAAPGAHGARKAAPRTQPATVKPRSTPAPKALPSTLGAVAPATKTPAKLTPPVKSAAPVKLSAPVAADATDDDSMTADGDAPVTMVEGKPMTTPELMVEYQRIGRDLKKLQDLRGTDCTLDLWPRFRAIKLDDMCKTAETRLELEGMLRDLRTKIDRRHGIELSAECLNNPLAANCQ